MDTNAIATSLKGGKARLMSDLPANSHIENTIKKENKRQRRRIKLAPTFVEIVFVIVGFENSLCELLNKIAPPNDKTVAEFTATVKISFKQNLSLEPP